MKIALLAFASTAPAARRARKSFAAVAVTAAIGFACVPAQAKLEINSPMNTANALAPAGSDLDHLNGIAVEMVTLLPHTARGSGSSARSYEERLALSTHGSGGGAG